MQPFRLEQKLAADYPRGCFLLSLTTDEILPHKRGIGTGCPGLCCYAGKFLVSFGVNQQADPLASFGSGLDYGGYG